MGAGTGEGTTRTPALLETPERHIGIQRVDTVDPGRPGLEFFGGIQSAVDVLSEDRGGETIEGIICLMDNVFLILELDENTNWAEDLLLHDLHVRRRVREDRGLNGSDGWISPGATRTQEDGVPR